MGEGWKIVTTQRVFEQGKEGYACYRIPAIVRNPKSGVLLAFAEARKYSCADHGYVDIVVKRSLDNGKSWSSSILVSHYPSTYHTTTGNPVPVYDTFNITGRNRGNALTVVLVFCVNNSRIFFTHSDNDGVSWEIPTEITQDVKKKEWTKWYATGPGHGLTIKSTSKITHTGGLFLIPCNHGPASSKRMLSNENSDSNTLTRSHVIYSADGIHWHLGGIVPTLSTNECQLTQLANSSLLLSMRNSMGHRVRAFSLSTDSGLTFSPAKQAMTLPDPTCEASILRASPNQASLLFSNPCSSTHRTDMCIHESVDGGNNWNEVLKVSEKGRQAAYSDLAWGEKEGVWNLVYEEGSVLHGYEYIVFVKFEN